MGEQTDISDQLPFGDWTQPHAPEGYEFTGEYRPPRKGEFLLHYAGIRALQADRDYQFGPRYILRPASVPQVDPAFAWRRAGHEQPPADTQVVWRYPRGQKEMCRTSADPNFMSNVLWYAPPLPPDDAILPAPEPEREPLTDEEAEALHHAVSVGSLDDIAAVFGKRLP